MPNYSGGGGGGGGGGLVDSVFGRTGTVIALLGDYVASKINNDSSVSGTTVKDALNTLLAAIPSVPVSSVFGRTGAVVAVLGDYVASKINNDSSVSGTTVKDALNNLPSSVFGRTGAVVATLNDYASSLIQDDSNLPGATNKDALNYIGQAINNIGNLGATPAFAFLTNRYQKGIVNANATVTFTTIPPAGMECYLELVQPASGGPFVISTWPSTVRWTDDIAPVLSTGASKRDLLRFISDGTQLIGAAHTLNMSA